MKSRDSVKTTLNHASCGALGAVVLSAGLAGAAAAPAAAADLGGGTLSYNAAVVSDYRFRGVSQTYRGWAPQGGIDWAHPTGFYLGTWASRVSKAQFDGSWGLEWDLYGGYKFPLGTTGLTGDVGLLNYRYPGDSRYNTLEGYFGVGWKWLSAKYSHTLGSKYFGATDARNTGYVDVTANYPLVDKVNLIGHFGATRGSGNAPDYADFRLGATYDLAGYILGLSWFKASKDFTVVKQHLNKSKDMGASGLVFSVGKTF